MKSLREMFTRRASITEQVLAQHSPDTVDEYEESDPTVPVDNTCSKNDRKYSNLCDIENIFRNFLPSTTFFQPIKNVIMEPAFYIGTETSITWNPQITEAISAYNTNHELGLIGSYRQIPMIFYMSFSSHSFLLIILPPLHGSSHSNMFSIGLKTIVAESSLSYRRISIISPDINPFKLLDPEPGERKGSLRRHNYKRYRTIVKAVEPLTYDFIESFDSIINPSVIVRIDQDETKTSKGQSIITRTKIFTNMIFNRNKCIGHNCSSMVEEFSKKSISKISSVRSTAAMSIISRPTLVQNKYYTHAELSNFIDNIIKEDDDKAIVFLFKTQALSNIKAYGKFRKRTTIRKKEYKKKKTKKNKI